MSQITSNAISAALTPIQRQQNDAIRARQIQSAKTLHHAEDVDELDDTGVDSIRDDEQNRGNQEQPDDQAEQPEDKVEIQSLEPASVQSPPQKPTPSQLPRLDISA